MGSRIILWSALPKKRGRRRRREGRRWSRVGREPLAVAVEGRRAVAAAAGRRRRSLGREEEKGSETATQPKMKVAPLSILAETSFVQRMVVYAFLRR